MLETDDGEGRSTQRSTTQLLERSDVVRVEQQDAAHDSAATPARLKDTPVDADGGASEDAVLPATGAEGGEDEHAGSGDVGGGGGDRGMATVHAGAEDGGSGGQSKEVVGPNTCKYCSRVFQHVGARKSHERAHLRLLTPQNSAQLKLSAASASGAGAAEGERGAAGQLEGEGGRGGARLGKRVQKETEASSGGAGGVTREDEMYVDLLDEDGHMIDDNELEARGLSLGQLAERLLSWRGLGSDVDKDAVAREFIRLCEALQDLNLSRRDFMGIALLLGIRVEMTALEFSSLSSQTMSVCSINAFSSLYLSAPTPFSCVCL